MREAKDKIDVKDDLKEDMKPTPEYTGVVRVQKGAEPKKRSSRPTIRKRNSFDAKAWESINKLRGESTKNADQLREAVTYEHDNKADGKNPRRVIRRRSTFDGLPSLLKEGNGSKGKLYGNMAQQFNILQSKMLQIQERHLQNIKETLGCDIVSLLFFNDQTRELMLCINERWYRVPCESGIAGWCVITGETLNIPDAYKDHRFNENIDKATGYRTKTILCSPLRANRGGGKVIGVIELINKNNDELFDSNDEELLSQMVNHITDDMASEFSELLELNSAISTFASPILPSDLAGAAKKRYGGATGTTRAYDNLVKTTKKYLEERSESAESSPAIRLGGDSFESERERRDRRKSFGEKLNQEIEANPELLHVRKN
mmetsp:Transcript_13374/g.20104  ORF Transcript_13374/g.20104 Transcript_13374/m.20104 type:complete len:375 (-) Transcript_13374:262-1386(-)